MNDEQQAKLIDALGKAFDFAATHACHRTIAARMILAKLKEAGFKVEMRKS